MNIHDIALSFVPGLGLKGAHHLLELFGSAEAIFRASSEELFARAQLHSRAVADALHSSAPLRCAEQELKYAEQRGIVPIAITDPAYPKTLRECPDMLVVEFYAGRMRLCASRK